jgi:hypothetical protein
MLEQKDRAALSSVIERHARLLSLVGAEVGDRPLVLPTAEFFPDRFTGDASSAERLVERMMRHAGLADVPLTTRVVTEDEPSSPHEGGCASGCAVPFESGVASPRLVDGGDAFVLNVPSAELRHPVVLTTMVARALGHVLLIEAMPPGSTAEAPVELTADYAAVALGFGPLLLEGAYIYSSGCGGPRVARVTCAGLQELAVLTALFVEMGGGSARRVMKELGATQADALAQALDWAKSNHELGRRLTLAPERVAAGDYSLRDPKPWLFRLFGKRRDEGEDALSADLLTPKAKPPAMRDPERDALASLVDEALRTARAETD